MFAALVANTSIVFYPILGLLIFFVFMLGVYIWVFLPNSKAYYARVSNSILKDD